MIFLICSQIIRKRGSGESGEGCKKNRIGHALIIIKADVGDIRVYQTILSPFTYVYKVG